MTTWSVDYCGRGRDRWQICRLLNNCLSQVQLNPLILTAEKQLSSNMAIQNNLCVTGFQVKAYKTTMIEPANIDTKSKEFQEKDIFY